MAALSLIVLASFNSFEDQLPALVIGWQFVTQPAAKGTFTDTAPARNLILWNAGILDHLPKIPVRLASF
jgi:hypothetical protein